MTRGLIRRPLSPRHPFRGPDGGSALWELEIDKWPHVIWLLVVTPYFIRSILADSNTCLVVVSGEYLAVRGGYK